MDTAPNLTGVRVLVLEDDYLLAYDTCNALSKVGAEVVGPCATEEDALRAIQTGNLHAAVTDINLGRGPSFGVAGALTELGIPFLFLTGYDPLVIPEEFREVPRLIKPVDTRRIVRELAQIL